MSITGQCRFKVRDRLRERFYGFQEGYSFIWLKRVCAVEQDTVFRVLSLTKGDFSFKLLEDRDPKPLKKCEGWWNICMVPITIFPKHLIPWCYLKKLRILCAKRNESGSRNSVFCLSGMNDVCLQQGKVWKAQRHNSTQIFLECPLPSLLRSRYYGRCLTTIITAVKDTTSPLPEV